MCRSAFFTFRMHTSLGSSTVRFAALRHYSGHVMCVVCLYCQFLQRSVCTASSYSGLQASSQALPVTCALHVLLSKQTFEPFLLSVVIFMYLFLVFYTFFDSKWRLILTLNPPFHRPINHENRDCARTHTNEQGRVNQKRTLRCPQLATLWEQDLHLVQRTPMSHHTMKAQLPATEHAHWVF